ncbi:MAG: hypothetical protein WCP28_18985, partial [Actinomycetes bacterium]
GQVPGQPPAAPGANGFNLQEAFVYSWAKFTANLGPLILAMLIFFAVGVVIFGLYLGLSLLAVLVGGKSCTTIGGGYYTYESCTTTGPVATGLLILITLVFVVVMVAYAFIIQAGLARVGLALTAGNPIEAKTLFNKERLGTIVVAGILIAIPNILGNLVSNTILFVLSIVFYLASIVVVFFSNYFVYYIVDKNMGSVDSIKASWNFVTQNLASLLALYVLSLAIVFVGALLCGVGLIVAVPIVVVAQAYAYRVLNNEPIAA